MILSFYIVAALWVAAFVWATIAHADGDTESSMTQTPDGKTVIIIKNIIKNENNMNSKNTNIPVVVDRQIVVPPDVVIPPDLPPAYVLGWVWTRYTVCPNPAYCQTVYISVVDATGLNVREIPNGRVVGSLVNGTPLTVLQREGHWTLVARQCDLVPTGLWSDTAGVPVSRCWIP